MSMKAILVTAAGVLAVTPAFAMTNSQIVHHTSGPIPYSQLSSNDRAGYNARSHKKAKAATTGDAVAANTPAAPGADQAPTAASPDASAALASPAPSATVNAPGAGAATGPTALPPATTSAPSNPSATTPPSGAPQ